MLLNKHTIKLNKDDVVVFSSDIIPGNEKQSFECLKLLLKKDLLLINRVLDSSYHDFHSTGHGYADEITLLIDLAKPKYFVPVHGNYVQCSISAKNAIKTGISEENIIIPKNGDVLIIDSESSLVKKVEYKEFAPLYIDENGQKIDVSDFDNRFEAFAKGMLIFSLKSDKKISHINYFFVNDIFKNLSIEKLNNLLIELPAAQKTLSVQDKIKYILTSMFDKPKINLLPFIYLIHS